MSDFSEKGIVKRLYQRTSTVYCCTNCFCLSEKNTAFSVCEAKLINALYQSMGGIVYLPYINIEQKKGRLHSNLPFTETYLVKKSELNNLSVFKHFFAF